MSDSEVVLLQCGDCDSSVPVPKRLLNLGIVRPCQICSSQVEFRNEFQRLDTSEHLADSTVRRPAGSWGVLQKTAGVFALTVVASVIYFSWQHAQRASPQKRLDVQNSLGTASSGESSPITSDRAKSMGTTGIASQSVAFSDDMRSICRMISADYTEALSLKGTLSNAAVAKHIADARVRHAELSSLARRNPGPLASLATKLASSSRRLDVLFNTMAPPESFKSIDDIGQALESLSSDTSVLAQIQMQRMEYFRETQEMVPELLKWMESQASPNRISSGIDISIVDSHIKVTNNTALDLADTLVHVGFFQHSKSDTAATFYVESLPPGRAITFSGFLADAQLCTYADCRVVGWSAGAGDFTVFDPMRVSAVRDSLIQTIRKEVESRDVREAEYSINKLRAIQKRFPESDIEEVITAFSRSLSQMQAVSQNRSQVPVVPKSSQMSELNPDVPRSTVDPSEMKGLSDQELVYLSGRNLIKRIPFDGQPSELTVETDDNPLVLATRPEKRDVYYVSSKTLWQPISRGVQVNSIAIRKFDEVILSLAIHPKDDRLAWCQVKPETHPDLVLGAMRDLKETNLGSAYDPQWTADGKLLIFTGVKPDWFIGIRMGTNLRKLSVPYHRLVHMYPTASPDLTKIVYSLPSGDGSLQLGVVTKDEEVYQWTETGTFNSWATFSPDGRFVAFIRGQESPCELIVKSVETGKESIVAKDCNPVRPAWIVSERIFLERKDEP